MTVRVVIADDQPLVPAGLRGLLHLDGNITVVGEAGDGPGALDAIRREQPDVALLDIRMPHVDGIEVTRRLAADPATAGVRVVVLTTFDIDEYIFAALRAGACGFPSKTVGRDELCRAVHVVAAGDALLSPDITRRVIAEFGSRRPEPAPDSVPRRLDALTDRDARCSGSLPPTPRTRCPAPLAAPERGVDRPVNESVGSPAATSIAVVIRP